MPEKPCTTCEQPISQCDCLPPPPPDTTGLVVELQKADRARRIAPVALLMGYAEWGMEIPEEFHADIKALCEHVYRTLCPSRSNGGAPPDLNEAEFRQLYWEAYHKVRLANLRGRIRRVTMKQVAKELLMSERSFYRNRQRYRLPWPPPASLSISN
jgi:hypothetical protein